MNVIYNYNLLSNYVSLLQKLTLLLKSLVSSCFTTSYTIIFKYHQLRIRIKISGLLETLSLELRA